VRSSGACGGDRWHIRTLQDRPRLLPALKTTIEHLRSLPRPKLTAARLPLEHKVFTVTGTAAGYTRERNRDIRFVLVTPQTRFSVYAAAPAPSCNSRATHNHRLRMGIARQKVVSSLCGTVTVTGVVFFTSRPQQRYQAPNRLELRPLLAFACKR
jgi:hypothetical protein